MVKVALHKVCKPLKEGDLGIRCLITLNEASNLKLCWELKNSQKPRAIFSHQVSLLPSQTDQNTPALVN